MEQLCKVILFILVLMVVLHSSSGERKGFGGKPTHSKKPSDGAKTRPNYPRQPSNPRAGSNPGHPNQQYPGKGGSNQGGYSNQNPGAGSYPDGGIYPLAGGNPRQYPGRGGVNPGEYPNQNPGVDSYPPRGSYPSAGGNPSQYPARGGVNPGGYPNQNPGAGTYPAGGNHSKSQGRGGVNPGGYPNQNPKAGADPAGGSYSLAGGNPSQSPGRGSVNPGGYPNQNPGAGTYPAGGNPSQSPGRGSVNPGGYPNQNPGAGTYPASGNPRRDGYSPGGFPATKAYPVRIAEQPGVYPERHPSIAGGYSNWNPNNKILSPRHGGSFQRGVFEKGGSPFSQTVKNMGFHPSEKSKGFAKKAMLAAGAGAVAGMAIGYGIGRFRHHIFQFSSPQEEHQYNHYMYQRQVTRSKDEYNKGRPNNSTDHLWPFDLFMNICVGQKDLLKNEETKDFESHNIQRDEPLRDYPGLNKDYEGKSWPEKKNTISPKNVPDHRKAAGIHKDEVDDTVSIMEIGYPALIEQMKARKCVERYMDDYYLVPRSSINHYGHHISGLLLWLTTSIVLFSST